jgi:cell wall-associated NlpC family hydrolase
MPAGAQPGSAGAAIGYRRRPARARVFRITGAIALSALLLGLAGALPAAADDAAPTAPAAAAPAAVAPAAVAPAAVAPATADEAKQAWLDAARRAETYNEQVLAAEATVAAAKNAAATAAAAVTAAADNTAAEQVKVDAADQVVAQFQRKVDAFANASFQGARLTDLSVLLTAASPEDYLDQASSLSQVATDQQTTLTGALAARKVADDARLAAQVSEGQADDAKRSADQATADAEAARAALDTGKAQLDAEIATYQIAFAQLSTADINSAVAGAEAANLDAASQARQAEQAAQRDRAGLASDAAPLDFGADYSAWAAQHAPNVQAGIAVEAALSRQGLPYVWAAEGPDTFDCSSLMMWAWAQAGVSIPRNSAAQADALPEVPLDQLQIGDLVTFYSPVSHVGMYVGDGKVLHASMPGVPIKVVELAAAGPNPTGHHVTP